MFLKTIVLCLVIFAKNHQTKHNGFQKHELASSS
jgi:hypothetical protein